MTLLFKDIAAVAVASPPVIPDLTPYLYYDTAYRANSTSSAGSPEKGTYAIITTGTAAVFGIFNNQIYQVSQGTSIKNYLSVNVGVADHDFTATAKQGSNNIGANIIFRGVSASVYLMASWTSYSVTLTKMDGSFRATLSSVAATLPTGATRTIRVVAKGTAISVYIDGVSYISYTLAGADATLFVGTKIGFTSDNTSGTGLSGKFSLASCVAS